MTRKILMLFILILVNLNPAQAQNQAPSGIFLIDIVLFRPVGLAATVAGTAVFIALSPLTAFANIPKPHNAFDKTAQFLIQQPAKFTFERPLGVYYPDEDGRYPSKK